jgi:nucleoside-diphosphate-sugar epimerase
LRAAWQETPPDGLRLHWASRREGADIQWDMLGKQLPDLPKGAIVLHLAGSARGPEETLAGNAALIPPLVRACAESKARSILFASTAAVYAPGLEPATEADPPAPQTAYGRSKHLAERLLQAQSACPVHLLRIGNVAGADALLGPRMPPGQIVLDPVPGRPGGPVRSWIGPRVLAGLLADLCRLDLPPILNLAQDPPIAMADLLQASGLDWCYGPPAPTVVSTATLSTRLLRSVVDVRRASARQMATESAWARAVLA